jgi:DNA-binding NtrC family response regulator
MPDQNAILVVEDNDFIRMQIVNYLKGAAYEVIEAREGRAAMEVMAGNDNGVSLAIVDVRMEPADGFEFIKDLRGREIHTPVILISGDSTTDLLEQARKFGVGTVLLKPVEKDRLLMTVERTLKQARRIR